ncbi:MAG: TRAP transporter small permease subunit [Gammaproteobacteria bacterium]
MSTASLELPYTTDSSRFSLLVCRFIAWSNVAILFIFLLNVYLNFWRGWPGATTAFSSDSTVASWLQVLLYALGLILPLWYVRATAGRNLRDDSLAITAIASYITRFAFWAVLLIGLTDAVISFLRVEELLVDVVGDAMAQDLSRSRYRGPYVQLPLIILSLVLAAVTRTLGFTWLALLVVVAELQIVISRFVFSYEQAFMGDLVRFWYAGLFLFSSAYTLLEDGHVRVDVLYHGFSERTRGVVNAIGALFLGLPLCWTVLLLGMGQSTSIITSPILALEITQQGFGMYVKYLMAAMLGVFAVTMAIQFVANFLESIADYCNLPGKRQSSIHSETVA